MVDPHRHVFKGEIQPEELPMYDASWIHFVLIATDDWPVRRHVETSCCLQHGR